jgi:hypothetical protein
VEAQNNGTAAQNTDFVVKAARCTLVISEKTTMITKLQLQLKMQQELVTATEKSRVELQKNATAATEGSTALQDRLHERGRRSRETTRSSCARGEAIPRILTTDNRSAPQEKAEAEEKESCCSYYFSYRRRFDDESTQGI